MDGKPDVATLIKRMESNERNIRVALEFMTKRLDDMRKEIDALNQVETRAEPAAAKSACIFVTAAENSGYPGRKYCQTHGWNCPNL